MLSAITGDIIGSIYEYTSWEGDTFSEARCLGYDYSKEVQFPKGVMAKDFPLIRRGVFPTDDSVLTCAVMDWILNNSPLDETFKKWFGFYPVAGYASRFWIWAMDDNGKHPESIGNGAAMRVSPIAWAYNCEVLVAEKAREQAEVTHCGDGVKAAEAVALGIFWAKLALSPSEIAKKIIRDFNYDLETPLDVHRKKVAESNYSCLAEDTLPIAFRAFLEGENYEDTIRKVISVGGDVDTTACIAGGLAGAYHGMPQELRNSSLQILDERMTRILLQFEERQSHHCWYMARIKPDYYKRLEASHGHQ